MSDPTEGAAPNADEMPNNPAPEGETLKIPPQVKFGIAIMELTDGSVVRMPINPHQMHMTYGMAMRMMMGELEDMRAEMLALKVRKLLAGPAPGTDDQGGLVDLA